MHPKNIKYDIIIFNSYNLTFPGVRLNINISHRLTVLAEVIHKDNICQKMRRGPI